MMKFNHNLCTSEVISLRLKPEMEMELLQQKVSRKDEKSLA